MNANNRLVTQLERKTEATRLGHKIDAARRGLKTNAGRFGRRLVGGWFLLLLPLLAASAALHLRAVRGPHWLSENLDPTYPYLLNSLNVANLHRPFHIHHPGTPVQSAGGVIIRLANPLSREQATAREVLLDPERYIRLISTCFIIFYAIALAAAGFAALEATRSTTLALLFQTAPFVSATSVEALNGVRPEPLLAAVAALLAGVALLALRYDVSAHARRFAVAFGLLVGLGVACKINFAPLAALPLLLLPRLRPRLEFCAAALASFVFFIAPIITPYQMRAVFDFFTGIVTHQGRYGSGAPGFADPRRYAESAARLVAGEWPFFALVAAGLVALAWSRTRRRAEATRGAAEVTRGAADERRTTPDGHTTHDEDDDARTSRGAAGGRNGARVAAERILFAAVAAELLQLLLVAKHPGARYLVPSLGLAGLNLVLLARVLKPARALTRTARFALLLTALALVCVQARQMLALRRGLVDLAREQFVTYELSEREARRTRVARYYSSSSPAYAIKLGCDYSNNFYGALLEELYPGHLFWNPWTGRFSNFKGRLDNSQARPALGDSFVLHGYSLFDSDFRQDLPPNPLYDLSLEDIHRGRIDRPNHFDGEALYRASFRPGQ